MVTSFWYYRPRAAAAGSRPAAGTNLARSAQADRPAQVDHELRFWFARRMAEETEDAPVFTNLRLRSDRGRGDIRARADELPYLILGLSGFHHLHDFPGALLVED
ncbi:MAG: hypothetical protein ACRD3B_04650, partial [Candidatus Sulfotelmatobacter sp.]